MKYFQMNFSGRGRRKTRTGPSAAAGSVTQMETMMHNKAEDSSQNAGQRGDVLPKHPQLVAAETEKVMQVFSNEDRRGEKRRKRRQKGSDSKMQRAPSTSGTCTDSNSNDESSNDTDSS